MVLAEDLRQAVLQAAIQGKLTEQLETDSSVDEMLKDIREEKKRLIADNKIKKEKILPKINDEDIPFDIPENWKFVRLGEIALYLDAGKSPDCIKENVKGNEWGVITTAIQVNSFFENENKRLPKEFKVNKDIKIKNNDILITRAGPMNRTGIMCLVERIQLNLLLSDKTVRVNIDNMNISKKFIVNAINAPNIRLEIINMMSGMDKQQVNISQEKIRKIIIPIPPIEEQQRIVDKINEIMPKIDEYEKIEKELESLKKVFPENMKDALLQAAMQGKLTEQLESDSSVDELLALIKKEKEELIAQKKIKREKLLLDIEEEEIPFDIPDNWRWVRMGNIIKLISGQDLPSDKYLSNGIGIPYLTGASNFQNGNLIINRYTQNGISIAYKGDLLLTCKGTIGEMAFMDIEKAHIARQIMGISTIGNVNLKYIKLCLENFILKLRANARSIIPGIDRKFVLRLLIPLPPIEEQQRIVKRLDELLPLCEDLKEI